jgi:hypothetical protein
MVDVSYSLKQHNEDQWHDTLHMSLLSDDLECFAIGMHGRHAYPYSTARQATGLR